jgi:hypothetical protein
MGASSVETFAAVRLRRSSSHGPSHERDVAPQGRAPRFFRQLLHQAASMVAMSIFVIGIIASGDSPFF